MKTIDLQQFCLKHTLRVRYEQLMSPVVCGGYTIATDAAVLIRFATPFLPDTFIQFDLNRQADRAKRQAVGRERIPVEGIMDLPTETVGSSEGPIIVSRLGDAWFQQRYLLALVFQLDHLSIVTNGPEMAAYLEFEGGDGLIMPYTIPEAT